jgi:hypothetical protein
MMRQVTSDSANEIDTYGHLLRARWIEGTTESGAGSKNRTDRIFLGVGGRHRSVGERIVKLQESHGNCR